MTRLNELNLNMLELKLVDVVTDFMLYDYYIRGQYEGQLEVQLEDDELNGKVLFTSKERGDDNGEFDWEHVKVKEVYDVIYGTAKEDLEQIKENEKV